MTSSAAATPPATELNLLSIIRLVSAARWLILGMVMLGLALATVAFVLMKPVYEVEIVLAPIEEKGDNNGLGALASQLGGVAALAGASGLQQSNVLNEAIATLKSRDFLRQFIDQYQLMPLLFEKHWDADNAVWRKPDDAPTLHDAHRLFTEIFTIKYDRRNSIVTLLFEWHDPVLAATWLNDMVELLNQHTRTNVINGAEKSLQYLKDELRKTNIVELRQAIYRLTEAEVKKIMLANVRDDYIFKVIDPAIPPDEDNYIRPKPVVLFGLGFVFGLVSGLFLAFARNLIRQLRLQAETV